MDEKTQNAIHTLSNSYAKERVDGVVEALEKKMRGSNGQIVFSREQIKAEIGRMLAVSYAKGYADCTEHVGPRQLFI